MAAIGQRTSLILLGFVFAAVLMFGTAVPAQAAYVHTFSSSFNLLPAGEPASVAIDEATGTVYVLNIAEGPKAGSILKFDSAGNPANFSSTGTNVIKVGCHFVGEEESSLCSQIAVDNSGGANQGVIYASSELSPAFEPATAGIKVFLPSGQAVSPITSGSQTDAPLCGVAVDPSGNVFVARRGPLSGGAVGLIDKYQPSSWQANPTQTPPVTATLTPLDFTNPCKSAVDSAGAVYLIRGFGPGANEPLRRFGPTAFGPSGTGSPGAASAIVDPTPSSYAAVDLANNDLYSDHGSSIARIDSSGSLLETFGAGPQLTNSIGVAVNKATKTVYASNQASGNISIYTTLITPDVSAAASPKLGGVGFTGDVDPLGAGDVTDCHFEYKLETEPSFTSVPCDEVTPYTGATDVTGSASGLTGGVAYQYRLVAANANGATVGPIKTFRIEAPSIEAAFTSELSATTAVLHAKINPHGAATKYRFEYGSTSDYGNSAPIPDGDAGSGDTGQGVSVQVSDLAPFVAYHFRVVATSAVGTATSEDQTFTFFPPSCPNAAVRQQTGSSYLPDCRAYELVSPRNAGSVILFPDFGIPAPYANNPARYAFSGAFGQISGTEASNSFGVDIYVATRTNAEWVTTFPGIPASQSNGVGGATANLSLSTFLDFARGIQPATNLPFVWRADGSFVARWPTTTSIIPDANKVDGAFQPSPDFSHLAFSSNNVAFVPNGLVTPPGSAYDFDTAAGTTTLISKTPAGDDIPQEPGNASATDEKILFPGVSGIGPVKINPPVSTDGSHILMSTASAPGSDAPVRLYMRVKDAVTYDVTGGGYGKYIGMTADGSRVFLTSTEALTPDDHDTSVDLYEWSEGENGFDSLTRLSAGSGGSGDTDACNATWTTQCNAAPIARIGNITDTSIASQNGDIYFYSPEQLDGNKGKPDQRNLYVYRNGNLEFVAVADAVRMQITPDGAHMAMVADEQLTSYDNKGFDEMYDYAPSTGRLRCVSCIPNGAPPTDDVTGSLAGLYMSDDGRTFFYSPDAVVPGDTNNLHDVYEFVEGRPQLITTGTGSRDIQVYGQGNTRPAGLTAVSADGVDVFFATYEILVDQDENGEFLKIYDARTGGGFPVEVPLQPCVAADECHGRGNAPPSPPAIVSEGNPEAAGGTRSKAKHRQSKRHKRSKKSKRHHKSDNRRTERRANG